MSKVPVLAAGLSREVFPINETRRTELRAPSKEARALPFYWHLPKDHLQSLKWRIWVREKCLVDKEFRATIWEMCKRDIAFFAETFCIIFEPRPVPRAMPMKLWEDQVDILAWSDECYGKRDMGVEKSRGIGVSWLYVIFMYHKWLFHPGTKIGLMSKDETSLDTMDENSLMGKIQYLHNMMPEWAKVHPGTGVNIMRRNQGDHTMYNIVNGATIQGFVPTDQKMRSLRFTTAFFDEFAFLPNNVQAQMNSSVHTTPNRFFVSTWNGPGNEFHNIMRKKDSTLLRCEMYWWNNTERWKGCYQGNKDTGQIEILDKEYNFPKDYPFVCDGLIRSPWVDFELSRPGSSVQSALEELYGLTAEDGRKLFRQATLQLVETTVRQYLSEGKVDQLRNELRYIIMKGGDVKCWAELGNGKLGPFAAGCDLSFGRGATYSTLEVIDIPTGDQVLEFAVNDQNPVEFARSVVRILEWLNGYRGEGHTYLTFENNGDQGAQFLNEVKRLGYHNIEKNDYSAKGPRKDKAQYYGVRNRDGGDAFFAEMERAIQDGDFTVRSELIRQEMDLFGRDEKTEKPHFPAGDALGHGDRTQGISMAWNVAKDKHFDPEFELDDLDPQGEIKHGPEYYQQEADSNKSWADSWRIPHRGF